MKPLYNFLKLKTNEKYLLIRTMYLMWAVRIMLWILPFKVICKFIKEVPDVEHNDSTCKSVKRLVWAVRTVSNYVPNSTCLTQALTGKILFIMEKHPSDLKIGVLKNENDQFEAHAWLEFKNRIVLGKLNTEFSPLLSLN